MTMMRDKEVFETAACVHSPTPLCVCILHSAFCDLHLLRERQGTTNPYELLRANKDLRPID